MKPEKQDIPLNILLADDDTDDRFFFEKALKEITIATNITTVKDGEELMQYLSENTEHLPDILFLDLSMPRKNGFECLYEIKENTELKDIPVVMFSTSYTRDVNYEQDLINRLYRIGANDYIRKPGDFEQLKMVIHHSLTKLIENKLPTRQLQDL
jgi:CheY-like chemotaxis protein